MSTKLSPADITKKAIEFERLCKGTITETWKVDAENQEIYYISKQGEDGYCRTILTAAEHGDARDLKFVAWAKNNQKLILRALVLLSKSKP